MHDNDTRTTSELKARHAAAVRWGNDDEAALIRGDMKVGAIVGFIRRTLDGEPPLTADQAERVCQVLYAYAEESSLGEVIEAMPAQVMRHKERLRGMVARGVPIDPIEVVRGN